MRRPRIPCRNVALRVLLERVDTRTDSGVFAQLYGTVELLEPDERARVKATVINKFRGDVSILQSGLDMLYDLVKIPCAGVMPYVRVDIDDEDSLSERLTSGERRDIDIAACRCLESAAACRCSAGRYPTRTRPRAAAIIRALCARRGISFDEGAVFDVHAYRESQYDKLADSVRGALDAVCAADRRGMRAR